MRSRAAILHDVGGPWSVEEFELDPPRAGAVLVETAAAGLCHSDDHILKGDMSAPNEVMRSLGLPTMFPTIGGHEGSGIEPHLPLAPIALLSCAIPTGYSSAANRAGVGGGDTVVVIGAGGIGKGAIQSARVNGAAQIVAVDPVDFKQKSALQFGATHSAATVAEAFDLVRDLTYGVMVDAVVVSPSLITADDVRDGLKLTCKGGTCVLTGMTSQLTRSVKIDLQGFMLRAAALRPAQTNHAHQNPILDSRNGLPHTTAHRSPPENQPLRSISAENGPSRPGQPQPGVPASRRPGRRKCCWLADELRTAFARPR